MITTRRSALHIIGGCLLVPSLKIQPEHDLHGIVQSFCGLDTWSRYDLEAPFVVGGHAYGTDGFVAARIEASEADRSNATRRLPAKVNQVWDEWWNDLGRWRPLPHERLIDVNCVHPVRCQPFGHKLIGEAYFRKVQRIPGAMWRIGDADRRSPILIKSDIGVECVLMPVHPGK